MEHRLQICRDILTAPSVGGLRTGAMRFSRFMWLVLGFNLVVILWGAFVRASGSGAGCGGHWPLCNGEVIPRNPTLETLVEFSHRLTSGIALILVVVALVWAFRSCTPGHPVRKGASWSLFFMVTEALVGAGLVLLEYVAQNKSFGRAIWISVHLINTFLLIAAITFTAWAATTGRSIRLKGDKTLIRMLAASFAATLVLGVSGAVTALGATLFPITSLTDGLSQDISPLADPLTRLRIIHPVFAIAVGALLVYLALAVRRKCPFEHVTKASRAMILFIEIQLFAGIVNLLLHAPVWLQLLHLLLSDLIWISLVLLACSALSEPRTESRGAEAFGAAAA